MKQFLLRLASTFGVCIIVVFVVLIPLFFIKVDDAQNTYLRCLLWVSVSFHIMRFMDWL